jgi:hypothetical protein
MLSEKQLAVIEAHVTKFIGKPETVFHEIIPFDVHVDIELVLPAPGRPYYTAVTAGMSEHAMTVPKGEKASEYAELMLCLPPSWKVDNQSMEDQQYSFPFDWLRLMARFPREVNTFLAPGHTLPNGDPPEPLAPDSEVCCLLIREPVTAPAGFQELDTGKKKIGFYAVVPIYGDEMRYKLDKGYEALDGLFLQHGVTELLDMKRRSVLSS